jgi:hypothetical protein
MAKSDSERKKWTNSDFALAFVMFKSVRPGAPMGDKQFKIVARSRVVQRSHSSWSQKITNYTQADDLLAGRTNKAPYTGNAERSPAFLEYRKLWESDPEQVRKIAASEVIIRDSEALDFFVKLGFKEGQLAKGQAIDFRHVSKDNVLASVSDYDLSGRAVGFKDSVEYDLLVDQRRYPPKMIMGMAYKLATGETITGAMFEGGLNTPCFKRFEELGFSLVPKDNVELLITNFMNPEQRLICALAAKPFVILAGGTGTGKSMAALNVAKKLAPGVNNYEFVAVGADWTDNRPLLGYENILRAETTYTVPKTLEIIIEAGRKPQEPFFIILDEMNLSHVERYFSDFLSIMEAKKVNREASTIKLHSRKDGMRPTDGNLRGGTGAADDLRVPDRIEWPSNLFVIGTVNVDETTHMFSPKVLDRAHVIEFKPDRDAVKNGMGASPAQANAGEWLKIGSDMVSLARGFAEAEEAKRDFSEALSKPEQDEAIRAIMGFWDVLEGTRFKFSYRTGQEALRYVRTVKWLARRHTEAIGGNTSMDALLDLAILQKILPKINGSAETLMTRLQPTKSEQDDKQEPEPLLKALLVPCEKLKESAAKVNSMQATLEAEHFVSFIQ